jgi:hypothetical protein
MAQRTLRPASRSCAGTGTRRCRRGRDRQTPETLPHEASARGRQGRRAHGSPMLQRMHARRARPQRPTEWHADSTTNARADRAMETLPNALPRSWPMPRRKSSTHAEAERLVRSHGPRWEPEPARTRIPTAALRHSCTEHASGPRHPSLDGNDTGQHAEAGTEPRTDCDLQPSRGPTLSDADSKKMESRGTIF